MKFSKIIMLILLMTNLLACNAVSKDSKVKIVSTPLINKPINSSILNNYFRRAARYEINNGNVIVIAKNSPRLITMDEWPQMVYLAADGEHTIAEFVEVVSQKYKSGVPAGLSDQIVQIINDLEKEQIIELTKIKNPLPYYLAIPIREQDQEKAKKMMEVDGYIKVEEEKKDNPPSGGLSNRRNENYGDPKQ